ncbi:ABC transporter permease [Silicimonas algicola]|nr:ABC transporter permease [Silicimonas algicola]
MRDTISVLVMRDQKSRFKSTVMGVFWAVASPMLFLLTFYLLFKVILPLQIPNYAAHLFIGIVVWSWFQGATSESVTSIVANSALIAQPGFPAVALPLSVTTSHLLTLILTLPVLVVILLFSGTSIGLSLIALPVVMAAMFIFVLAVSYLVAGLNVSFRDMQYIVPIVLQLGYFTTPIFYDATNLPDRTRAVLGLNPMLHIIEAFRAILMRDSWPDWGPLSLVLGGSLCFLWLSQMFFRRASLRFLEEL